MSYFSLIIFHTISCPLYNSKTVRAVKLGTLIKHDELCTRIITLAFISLELFPFDYFSILFHVCSIT